MDLNRIPRWALIGISLLGLSSMGIMVSTARADLDRFKAIAYQAKNTSEMNTEAIAELKDSVKEVRISQETFRSEYRTDQKDLNKTLQEIIRAVKQ